ENYSDNFEEAQDNKLAFLTKLAHIGPHTESMLDIGCGWGANIEYQATVNKVPDVHGVTLSIEQHKKCVERTKHLGNVTAVCGDFMKYEAPKKFDALTCICMMEHLVTPEDARAGKAVDIYREFFKRAHSMSKPGSYFALQAITRCGVPRNNKDLDD